MYEVNFANIMWNAFGGSNDIMADDALERIEGGWDPYIIDVRSFMEVDQSGVAAGTVLVQPAMSIIQIIEELPDERDFLLICASGARSGMARNVLNQAGFPSNRLFNLQGGLSAWHRYGGHIIPFNF